MFDYTSNYTSNYTDNYDSQIDIWNQTPINKCYNVSLESWINYHNGISIISSILLILISFPHICITKINMFMINIYYCLLLCLGLISFMVIPNSYISIRFLYDFISQFIIIIIIHLFTRDIIQKLTDNKNGINYIIHNKYITYIIFTIINILFWSYFIVNTTFQFNSYLNNKYFISKPIFYLVNNIYILFLTFYSKFISYKKFYHYSSLDINNSHKSISNDEYDNIFFMLFFGVITYTLCNIIENIFYILCPSNIFLAYISIIGIINYFKFICMNQIGQYFMIMNSVQKNIDATSINYSRLCSNNISKIIWFIIPITFYYDDDHSYISYIYSDYP
jgi:hypothetical protein